MLKAFVLYCVMLWAALVFADYKGYALASLFANHRHDQAHGLGQGSHHK
jgi:hypothetical protein